MTAPRSVGVLISGRGSNLQALIDACESPDFPASICLVISNVPEAAGLERAAAANIPTAVISHRDFPDSARFDAALDRALRDAGVELVCLAGFMRLLTAEFVMGWEDRILNIHPSLLPAFKGLHAQRDALDAGVKIAGCTVHVVRPEMDSGPVVAQAAVPVLPDDTEDSLSARILATEHIVYPLALRLIAAGQARVVGDTVRTPGSAKEPAKLINPSQS